MIFIKDDEFLRGKCPMTKEEVRILSIVKMNIQEDSNVLDIGSGTGSITVQSAIIAKNGKVLSIEKDEEPFRVTKLNIDKFACKNVKQILGEASVKLDVLCEEKIKFDSIFIGGSGGNLEDIIRKTDNILSDHGTIVMNFITIDNLYKAIETMKKLDYEIEISLVNISKNKSNTLMMISLNPIYIIKCSK